MSLISSGVALRHRCTIERDQNAGQAGAWGNESAPDWQPHLVDLPCRAWTSAAKEPIDDDKTVVLEDRRVTVQLGVDVTEADRLGDVTDTAGGLVFEGPMNIQGVLRYADHIELILERVR